MISYSALKNLTRSNHSRLFQGVYSRKNRHRYHWRDQNNQFVLEETADQAFYYMTTQKAGVILGDFIEIIDSGILSCYQIIQLEHYCEPPDMWMAKLRKLTQSLKYKSL